MRTLTDIRSTFLQFFKNQGHELVPSSPLVPRNDPTLLFTTAGMVQFKDVFTGAEKRPYTRATTVQKCLRAGGKHNDLENVGYTARHHTFFEMLGNFSFGDYFKEEAIFFAWDLVTNHFHLPKDRLLVTVYHEDIEAAKLWKKIAGLSEDRIIPIATTDNFWSAGDTGPCGPCTEIFFDHGESVFGGPPGSPHEDGDRFTEIWNLVFMQFDQLADGRRINLPKPSVDTGMGLERIAAALQGVPNNYDTDLFQALIQASIDLTGVDDPAWRQSHNVIADHLRACAFLLAEGVLPGNEGRGYVLRRIMRRAMRHAHLLGAKDPLMGRLAPTLINLMGTAYPELVRAEPLIVENLQLEEEKFRQTLDRGMRLLNEATVSLAPGEPLPGEVAFKLYDTFGFPLDLTQDVLKASHRTVDQDGFQSAMAAQKAAARAAWSGSGEAKNAQIWYDLHEEFGATEFLGYDALEAEGIIQALLVDSQRVGESAQGQEIDLLVNQTPFYAESGGQMGDQGCLVTASGAEITVLDTLKQGGSLHIHRGKVIKGTVIPGEILKLTVDGVRRALLRANHSATHLLHAALRQILGKHVTQKGSLVAPDRLRFDFTHTKPLSREEILMVERLVNHHIILNHEVTTHLMNTEQAINQGAMALFGERYGDRVRVLTMGSPEGAGNAFSVELCGGTHVKRTGDIGMFKVLSEAGVAAGIRRIEALTGLAALAHVTEMESTLADVSALAKTTPAELPERIEALLTERKSLKIQVADLRRQAALHTRGGDGGKEPGNEIRQVGGVSLIVRHLTDVPAKDLKSLVDDLKAQVSSGIVVVTSVMEGKVSLVVGVTPDLTGHVSAVDLVRMGAEALGGSGGGGRPDLAQAGGSNTNVSAVVTAIEGWLASR
ncbi:MAG: alanyl-tRNA synthetase [Alphaproteobacteria bacterium]|jgi:alanyl-tRNA synthetase|nr:alanyl-tRNA synthetase [Alphaproteobacteria bacterium]